MENMKFSKGQGMEFHSLITAVNERICMNFKFSGVVDKGDKAEMGKTRQYVTNFIA